MTNRRDHADVLVGRFWLADHDERSIPGRLTLGESASPRLELDEALTPLLRELEPARSGGGRTLVFADDGPDLESYVVHGVLDDGTAVTLVDAFSAKRKHTRARLDRQWLQAQFALLGGHMRGRDELYTSVRLRLRHLDAWAALPGLTLEELQSEGGTALTFQASDPDPVELAGGSLILSRHRRSSSRACLAAASPARSGFELGAYRR